MDQTGLSEDHENKFENVKPSTAVVNVDKLSSLHFGKPLHGGQIQTNKS